mgnify:FL=1
MGVVSICFEIPDTSEKLLSTPGKEPTLTLNEWDKGGRSEKFLTINFQINILTSNKTQVFIF